MKNKFASLFRTTTIPTAILFSLALLFSSCSKNELDDMQTPNPAAATSPVNILSGKTNEANAVSSRPGILADELISINHGACMGLCPAYRLTLGRSGAVVYTGIRNVRVTGTVRYNVSPDVAYELGTMMAKGGFFNFSDRYELIPDAQRFETSLVWNGNIKTVVDYGIGVPQELVAMRDKVEKALHVDRLITGQSNTPSVNVKQ